MVKKIFLILAMAASGCIDPITFSYPGQVEHLVIEAELSNITLNNLNYVRLSRSGSFIDPYNRYEENALVYIGGNEGEKIKFQYQSSGYYYPELPSSGIIGHTYALHIITPEGKSYQSEPVRMNGAPPVDSVYVSFAKGYTIVPGERNLVFSEGYNVYVDYHDPPLTGNYYRWNYELQYKVKTNPDNYIDVSGGYPGVRSPKKCCSICWISDFGQDFAINDDRLTNGNEIIGQYALFIPFSEYLNIRCKVIIYQHAISEDEYLFYKSMITQKKSNGSILDPPPSEIKGNIFNVENKDEKVIGFFDASGISVKEIYLNGWEFPGHKPTFVYDDDCRTLPNASIYPPGGWE